jgi:hypothetical protein
VIGDSSSFFLTASLATLSLGPEQRRIAAGTSFQE